MGLFQNHLMAAAASTAAAGGYTLWSWGQNVQGGMGQNNNESYSSPVQIGDLNDWTPMISAAHNCGMGIKSDGTLWSWGAGVTLGDGTTFTKSSPVQIGSNTDWYACFHSSAPTSRSAYAINTSGELFVWGINQEGMLGTGNKTEYTSPVQLAGTDWVACAGGTASTIAIKSDGTIWGWGDGGYGRTFHNNQTDYSSPVQGGTNTTWNASADFPASGGWENGVEVHKRFGYTQGAEHAQIIDSAGTLWGAGLNARGGNMGLAVNPGSSPVQVSSDTDWEQLCASAWGAVAVKDGKFTNWGGFNQSGEQGDGTTTYAAGTLTEWDGTVTGVAMNQDTGAVCFRVMNAGGTLYYSGDNGYGRMGNGTTTDTSSPVQGPATTDWVRVVLGYSFSLAVKEG